MGAFSWCVYGVEKWNGTEVKAIWRRTSEETERKNWEETTENMVLSCIQDFRPYKHGIENIFGNLINSNNTNEMVQSQLN